MAFFDVLFLVIAVYLLYKFIFNFLLPVMRVTQQVRQQFRNMQGSSNMNGSPNMQGSPNMNGRPTPDQPKGSHKPPADDYIDFEEVK